MNCNRITNDLLLAPTAEVSAHLSECADCRERQKIVALTARALRAMADDLPVPSKVDDAIRAAIPRMAMDAARRRPSSWWSAAAAAALLLAAGLGGYVMSTRHPDQEPPRGGNETAAEGTKPVTGAGDAVRPPVRPDPPVVPNPPPVVPKPPEVAEKPPDPPAGGVTPFDGMPLPPVPPDSGRVVVRPPDKPETPPEETKVVTIADCMRIMQGVVGAAEPAALDLNDDGTTDVADALLAARAVAEREGHR